MRYVKAEENVDIALGRQGENQVVTVQFDVSGWEEDYGSGEFFLLCERSKDTAAYPCTITKDGDTINWVVNSADVYYCGHGKVQLMYIVNSAIARSIIYYTVVLPSLDAGDMPEPIPEWIQTVMDYKLDSEAYALGTRNGVDVEEDDPTYHNNSKYFAQIASAIKIYYVDDEDTYATIETALQDGYLPVAKYNIDDTEKHYFGTAMFGNHTTEEQETIQRYNLYDVTGYELITISFKVDNTGAEPVYSTETSVVPLTVDEPIQNSTKYITSGGVWNAIEAVGNLLINLEIITQEQWDSR